MSNVKISDLTPGAALTGVELFEMTQASNSRSTTAAAIVTLSATWTADQQAAGFDIKDISNVELRTTTAAPAGTVRALFADAAGVHINALTATEVILQINGSTEFSVGATNIDFKGNNAVTIADITLTGNINFPDGVRQTFNPNATNSGLNVGAHTADPSSPSNGDIFYNSTTERFRLRQDGAWIEVGAGGLVSINGDTTAAQVMAAGTGLDIADVGATHTYSIDATVATLTGAQTLTNKTITAAANTLTIASTDLTDTADLVRNNTINSYTAGARQDFLGLLAGTAGLNVGAIAGSPTTQLDGDIWYDSNTNTMFGRINGADVDLGSQSMEIFTWTANHDANGNALEDPLFADPTDVTKLFDLSLSAMTTGVTLTVATAQASSQTLTIPTITGADSLVTNAVAATLTNKTFNSGTSFTSSPSIADGIRFTFNPDNTNSGVNVGENATDPTSPVNGDIYYQTGVGFRVRDQAAWITLGQPDTPWTVDHDADRYDLDNLGVLYFTTLNPRVDPSDGSLPYLWYDQDATPDALILNVGTGDEVQVHVNGLEQYSFSSTIFDMQNNILQNAESMTINAISTTGIMTVGRTNEVTGQDAGELRYRGGNTEYASIFSNMVLATGGSERGNLDFRVKVGNTTTLDNIMTFTGGTSSTSSTISFGAIMATQINMNGNNLDNVAILVSNDANEAGAGFVRMGADEYIAWRNNGDTNDNGITFNTADQIEFSIASLAAADYTFSSTVFDLIGRRIEQLLHIQDASQNEQLIFASIGSAVNEFTITNAATGTGPIFAATGGDADVPINIRAKGQGSITFADDDGFEELLVLSQVTGSASDFIQITNATAATNVIIAVAGITANAGLEIRSKGEDAIIITNDNNEETLQLSQVSGAATNFVDITNAITATGPIIAAAGSDTDVALNLTGKGIGSVVHQTSINTDTAGLLTIATAVITKTRSFHRIAGEGAAADTLSTINGGNEGDVLVLRSDDTANDITVDESGNIVLVGASFILTNVQDTLTLIFDGTNWLELSRSDNTA